VGAVLDRGRPRARAAHEPVVSESAVSTEGAAESRAGTASAWRDRRAWVTLAAVSVGALAADLGSKHIAFRTIAQRPVNISRENVLAVWSQGQNLGRLIPDHRPVTVVPHLLEFSLVLNPGAVFGMGAGMRWFFIAFTIGALALALWMFSKWTRAKDRLAHVALGLLIAGGVGNLYDRIVYACVRDFIHPLPGVRIGNREIWPYVSNVADLWLLIGIGILMWFLWRSGDPKQRDATSKARPETAEEK
jgi:signal peptidase II